ncbi:hypothetical protein ACFWTE_13105 [Nocardiopsis sp. NPDC058631]|uniref:hypothetical protein n=1 Tax=Nocardiopsis sp. NPDC058631 TaxID=3346566 RepID=UPI00365B6F3A
MRIAGIANLVMALIWVPLAITMPYQDEGLVGFFRVFNAVIFSAFTVIWIALEAVRYFRKPNSHQATSPTEEEPAP